MPEVAITHIVLCKFRADTSPAEIAGIWADLAALKDKLSGMVDARFGSNISPEGLAQGFNSGFVITFVDAASRDAYLIHPDHQRAGARLVAALEGSINGLVVLDI
jgi:hypothetical protein